MENDQDRWEYEVQRHQESDNLKAKLIDGLLWSVAGAMLAVLFYFALAA